MAAEAQIEAHLCKRVEAAGGLVRKVQWIGRKGAPDRFVMFPGRYPNTWVELKAPGKKPDKLQEREIARLRDFDEIVEVIDSMEAVDALMAKFERSLR